jgi:hypothetical protein
MTNQQQSVGARTRGILLPTLGAAFLVLAVAGVAAAPVDDFAAACGLSGKTSPESCRCQAKLAQSSFNAREMQAAIIGIKGDQTSFRAAVQGMGKTRAKVFLDKMRALAGKVSTVCS